MPPLSQAHADGVHAGHRTTHGLVELGVLLLFVATATGDVVELAGPRLAVPLAAGNGADLPTERTPLQLCCCARLLATAAASI